MTRFPRAVLSVEAGYRTVRGDPSTWRLQRILDLITEFLHDAPEASSTI